MMGLSEWNPFVNWGAPVPCNFFLQPQDSMIYIYINTNTQTYIHIYDQYLYIYIQKIIFYKDHFTDFSLGALTQPLKKGMALKTSI